MSGKAYTMREMKTIVEYLVEHKAYNEIRGRKMWMDFANAKALNRTWQSLKETFLKRILPDIHNPYYKLNITQIASFRQGCDVESKLNNKLDIELVDKDIDNENGHPKANDEKVIIDDDKEKEEAPGEASKISKSVADRTSTDTLVLENCYETAEDIQKELEHSDQDHDNEEEPTSTAKNNTEDLIQGVINDFQSDEDNVDELKQTKKKKDTANLEDRANLNGVDRKDQSPIEISDSEDKDNNLKIDEDAGNESPASLKIVEDVLDKNLLDNEVSDENLKNTSDSILSGNKEASDDRKGQINKDQIAKEKNDTGRISGNITNTTVDTQLPNNPEEFDKNCSKDNPADRGKVQKLSLKSHNKQNKKRATSQEAPKVKRKKLEQQMSLSDTDAVTNTEKKARKNIMPKKNNNTAIEEQIVNNDAQIVNLDSVSEEKTKSDAEKIENNSSKVETNIESEKTSGRNENSYAKQLSYTIYSDSGNSIDHTDTSKQQTRTSNVEEAQTSKTEQVLHSDSSIDEVQLKNKSALRLIEKKHRNNALSHALGFSHDIISSRKRRRSYNRKRSTSRHKTLHISSGTSDYTSDTMSEFISPPRGRKNRGTRKYLKPKSARILSLEEEGGLFVMHGKKIYPLVKDGKILKNYLTYTPDDESDKEESFWKLKYVEEKKKADQLAKLLKQATNSNKAIEDGSVVEKKELKAQQTSPKKVQHEEAVATTSEIKVPDDKQENTVKIKFTKNNEEVQLEGHWTHINPVLEQVVQMFNKNSKDEDKKSPGCSAAQRLSTPEAIVVSGVSTPVVRNDNGTNRVNEIESEIFKQIEEIDKAEAADTDLKPTQDVARRRGGRPRKNPAPIEKSTESPKKAKLSVETEKKTESKPDAPGTGVTTRRSTRTPKKVLNENTEKNIVINRKSSPRKAKDANRTEDPDDGVKYKFPSPGAPRARSTRRARNSYTIDNARICNSPDNPSLYSEDTTQGYVDSDCSPIVCFRKKRRCSISDRKQFSRIRKKSIARLHDDATSESSNSFVTAPLKSRTFTNLSVSSHIYRTESYQMLVPQTKNSTKPLEKIDECSQNISETDICHPNTNDAITGNNNNETLKNLNEIVENESSSMSLPTSPVLSIVENISVNKSLLSSIDEHSLNVAGNEKITLNELMSPDAVDVSMPLMERNYTVEKKGEDGSQYHYTINPKNPLVTDSFLNKVCTVKIHDITLSDSLSTKLRNLLIESAKKLGKQTQSVNENDVVKTVENDADPIDKSKRGKTKKRSSTPRKKKTISKTKAPNCEPFVEEEHTEMCAQAGRKSCPPLINIFQDVDMKQVESVEDTPITANANIKKDRKKKDVIKVKISRPKRKTDIGCEESPNNNANIPNKNTINDAESGIFLGINDSVDLIHNHSETCLQTHDCIIDNSVEIVQNSKSILSIDSSSIQSERENCVSKIDGEIALELLGSNAQDGTHLFKDIDPSKSNKAATTESIQNTPHASTTPNSLITEDLSGGHPSPIKSKWYFLSDEETTNCLDLADSEPIDAGYGANLNQIFPVTCAVPNLSTITEMSKDPDENTNTKKIVFDDNIKNEISSQSLFSNH